jgi:hypothetical protein
MPLTGSVFHAIIFTVHDCGYIARSALELTDTSQVTVSKILEIISSAGSAFTTLRNQFITQLRVAVSIVSGLRCVEAAAFCWMEDPLGKRPLGTAQAHPKAIRISTLWDLS